MNTNQDDPKHLDHLIRCYESFSSFFNIRKKLYIGAEFELNFKTKHGTKTEKIDSGTTLAALIPSSIMMERRFDEHNIKYDATKCYDSENKRIKSLTQDMRKSGEKVSNKYYVYFKNLVTSIDFAKELDETAITYTSQNSISGLSFLVEILNTISEMKEKNVDILYKNKTGFIEEFCNHCNVDDDRLFDHTIMSYSLNEISNIAQNINNNMFPGIL